EQAILLILRPLRGVEQDNLRPFELSLAEAAAPDQSEYLPLPIPDVIATRMRRRLPQLFLPACLQLRDFLCHRGEQFGPLPLVLRPLCQVSAQLTRQRSVDVDLVSGIEVGVELIKLLLRDRIVLMVVTAGAADRQSQPGCADHPGAVDDLLDAELFQIGAALAVAQRVAQEAGAQQRIDLAFPAARQQIAGHLADGASVEPQ